MIDFIYSVIDYIFRRGNLDGFDYDHPEYNFPFMWEEIPDDEKWNILYDAHYTGITIPDEYLQFGTLQKPMPKDYFMAKYTYMKDSLGDADYPYTIKYDDGTLIWTPELEPEQKIKSTGVLWILGGAGLCEDVYYAKNKAAEDDLIKYSGATFWKDGKIIKQ